MAKWHISTKSHVHFLACICTREGKRVARTLLEKQSITRRLCIRARRRRLQHRGEPRRILFPKRASFGTTRVPRRRIYVYIIFLSPDNETRTRVYGSLFLARPRSTARSTSFLPLKMKVVHLIWELNEAL